MVWSFVVFSFIEPLAVFPYLYQGFAIKGILAWAFLGLLVCLVWYSILSGKAGWSFLRRLGPPLGAWLLAGLISLIAVWNVPEAFRSWIWIVFLAHLTLVVPYLGQDLRVIRRWAAAVAGASVLVCGIGILEWFDLSLLGWTTPFFTPGKIRRIFSTIGHPNLLASFNLLLICISASGLWAERSARKKWLWGLVIILNMVCLYMTRSRGAWISLLGTSGLMFLTACFIAPRAVRWQRRHKVFWIGTSGLILVLAGIGATIIFGYSVPASLMDGSQRLSSIPAVQSRWIIWQGTFRMFHDHPLLGVGVGMFSRRFPEYRAPELVKYHDEEVRIVHAHNEYLEILAEMGLIGLCSFLAFLVLVAWRGLGGLRFPDGRAPDDRQIWLWGTGAGWIGLLMHGLVSVSLRFTTPSLFMWISMGWVLGLTARNEDRKPLLPAPSRRFRAALCFSLAALIMLFMIVPVRDLGYQFWKRRAEIYAKSGSGVPARYAAKKGLEYRPWAADLHVLLGSLDYDSGAFADAETRFLTASELDPGMPLIHFNLALAGFRQKKLNSAREALFENLRLNPMHGPSHRLMAEILIGLGRHVKAGSHLERALERDPGDIRALLLLGNLHALAGNYEMAIKAYQEALRKNPGYKAARENLAIVLDRMTRETARPPGSP